MSAGGLAAKRCVPCKGGVAALKGEALRALLAQVDPGWQAVGEHHLERELRFPDFASALAYVNRVGAMAEEQDHHPDIHLGWGRVRITIWTHTIDGLTESDFIFAAKCDALVSG